MISCNNQLSKMYVIDYFVINTYYVLYREYQQDTKGTHYLFTHTYYNITCQLTITIKR